MPGTPQVAQRIWKLFSQPTPPQRQAYMNKLKVPENERERFRFFSPFDQGDMKRARAIVNKWNGMVSANGRTEDQLMNAVLDDFEALRGSEDPDLLYFCLEVFITHFKGATYDIPSVFVREPELTAPSKTVKEVAVGSPNETMLDWFREDPLLNEHHAHWHVVYPANDVYDRQGEMFFYMHQQMLARYDAERIAAKVPRVVPFSDMHDPIKVGYRAGEDLRLSGFFRIDRPVNVKVARTAADEQNGGRQAIINDIDNGDYDPPATPGDALVQETTALNALGATLEASPHPDGREDKSYYYYHGNGHMAIANINRGVMGTTLTAIRDVIFWEWHKEIDTHYVRLQDRFEPYDFSRDAPPVLMRNGSDNQGRPDSMDIILCLTEDVPGFGVPGFDGAAIGKNVFGGDKWDEEFANRSVSFNDGTRNRTIVTTDTLNTTLQYGLVRYSVDGQQQQYQYEYLNHSPFCYFIRVQNTSAQQKQVTVRIFLAPDSHANDRTMWIEMDKFLHELMPDSRTVIFRSDDSSSVIRKPAQADPLAYATTLHPVDNDDDRDNARCRCGWPYHMLLPKGSNVAADASYKLVVMISDADIDAIESERDCGSLSFCGSSGNQYPDKRPLGYPFNRKFKGNGNAILNTVTTQQNFACRSIRINHSTGL